MKYTFSTDDAARLLNVPRSRVACWASEGRITPTVKPRGSGTSMRFSLVDVLATGAGLGLRSAGFSLAVCEAVTRAIATHSESELQEHFARGQTHLLFLPAKQTVYPGLVPESAISNPEVLKLAQTSGILPSGINVRALYESLIEKTDKLIAESN